MRATVFIFAKTPRMGAAKTRLARGLGKAEAQRLARMACARTLRAARDPRWRTVLCITPDTHCHAQLGGLWPRGLERRPQGRGDLGARLDRAWRAAPLGPVIFLGTDTPDVTRDLIWRAVKGVGQGNAVIGPARDGGFWLLGLGHARTQRAPFEMVRWSSPHTLADVLANLPAGLPVQTLPVLIDLDEASDWRDWAAIRRR